MTLLHNDDLISQMSNIYQLRQLMTLHANMNAIDIEGRFKQIAKMLFESFAIQKGKTMYLFKEIEINLNRIN